MIEQIFRSPQVKRSSQELSYGLGLYEMGKYQKNLKTSQNYCLLVSPLVEMKNQLVLVKISCKTEIETVLFCAISLENQSLSQKSCEGLQVYIINIFVLNMVAVHGNKKSKCLRTLFQLYVISTMTQCDCADPLSQQHTVLFILLNIQ